MSASNPFSSPEVWRRLPRASTEHMEGVDAVICGLADEPVPVWLVGEAAVTRHCDGCGRRIKHRRTAPKADVYLCWECAAPMLLDDDTDLVRDPVPPLEGLS